MRRDDVVSTTQLDLGAYPIVAVSSPTHDELDVADQFKAWLSECETGRPVVVNSIHGRRLAAFVEGAVACITPPARADQALARDLIETIVATDADVVVAIGGGRCLDVAKLAAAHASVPLLAVPTQLSHDGICSPVAVLPGVQGVAESLPAVAPVAAFFSIPTLMRAPIRSMRAGLGDLLTNPLALRDWELAAELGVDELHEAAWHLSMESYGMVDRWLDGLSQSDARHPHFIGLLAYALANSGLAMMRAGSSRPASGAEHKISHAIDQMYGTRAMHGEQVAFASIIAATLHGLDITKLSRRLMALELPHHPSQLGLSYRQLAAAIVRAPGTRPERYTVLEQAGLDEREALKLVTSLWPDA